MHELIKNVTKNVYLAIGSGNSERFEIPMFHRLKM